MRVSTFGQPRSPHERGMLLSPRTAGLLVDGAPCPDGDGPSILIMTGRGRDTPYANWHPVDDRVEPQAGRRTPTAVRPVA